MFPSCWQAAEIVKDYAAEHGEDAMVQEVTVHRITDDGNVGQPVDPRDFL